MPQQGGMRLPMQSSQPPGQQVPPHSGSSSAQGFNSQPGISHQPFSSYGAAYNVNRTSGSVSQPATPGSGIPGMSSINTSGSIVTSANRAPIVSAPLAVVTGNVPNQPTQSMTPNMQALEMEIQQLQNQVQQLYQTGPQNPETQQKMLDLQERARSLRGQQQTQLLLQQRNQQQQQQAPPMMSPGPSVSMASAGPPSAVPVRPSAPNMMMQQQLSPMPAPQVKYFIYLHTSKEEQ